MRRVRARPVSLTRRLCFVSNYNAPLHSASDPSASQSIQPDASFARLLNPIVLLDPGRIVAPPSWLEHIPFAFWIVAATRPRVFVELGTHTGNSYAAFAQAIEHLGLPTAAYSVDTWKGDPQAGFYGEAVFDDWRAHHDRRFSAFSRLLRGTFDDALAHFADGSIDLLHLDGLHTLEAVRHDVETWLPKLSDRGVLLMHDTNVRERDFGAWKVWEELRERFPGFEFLHGHGLGVLAVGSDQPPEVAWLTGLTDSPAAVTQVRWFFSRVGASVALRHELDAERERAAATAAANAAAADGLRETIDDAGRRLREAEAEIAAFRNALEQADADRERQARAHADAERDGRAKLEEIALQLAAETRARGIQQQMTALPATALAGQQHRADAYQARATALQQARAGQRRAHASRAGRLSHTLRALGLAPSTIVRNPASVKTLVKLALAPRRLFDAHVIAQSGVFDAGYYGRDRGVAASGTTPLAHYVLDGARERRSPHPLFDGAAYAAAYPDVAASGVNPLAHYLRRASAEPRTPHPLFSPGHYRQQTGGQAIGAPLHHYVNHGVFQGLSPHPLFDPDYYVRTYGADVGAQDPLQHFLDAGAAADFNPHPLFDTAFYRSQAPELAGSGINPLVHYLQAPAAGRRPHPLFDPAFYLATYPDVAAAGIEPLTHYVLAGGSEGRFPIPEFDSAWYAGVYPDVVAAGFNPLAHFVTYGWLEGRNPSRHFDTTAYLIRYPDVLALRTNPLLHYVRYGAAEGRVGTPGSDVHAAAPQPPAAPLRARNLLEHRGVERVVVCLTHASPIQPRAGNEYRIHRMLHWLRRAGYTVVPVFAPPEAGTPPPDVVRAIAAEFGNAVVCPPNGQIQYILRDIPDVLRSLDLETPPSWHTRLGEHLATDQDEREALTMDRAFCTDAVISTMLRLQSALAPYALIAEYIWMSRVLPLIGRRALRVIDTIDVFSNKHEKVGQFGIDDLTISREGEALRLRRADLVIAIQGNEQSDLAKLVPDVPVITTGVDFEIDAGVTGAALPEARRVLYVASGNPMNRRGLKDFLRFAWPRIRTQVPDAELAIAGRVADAIPVLPPGVTRLGLVEDLTPLYRDSRVVINPAVAGTGLKIKTIEALSYLRPIVTWPNGIDGLSPAVAELCLVAKDWPEFASLVVRTLAGGRREWFDEPARAVLAEQGSQESVYAALARELDKFFAASRAAADAESQ